MGTISVGQSIGGAFGFLFRRFLTILSLSWLPAAIYAVGRLGFLWHVEPRLMAEVHGGGHPSITTILMVLAYALLTVLLMSMVALALTRDALDLRDQPVLARFVVGARELRLVVAYICIHIVLILLCALLIAGVIGAMWLAKWAFAQGAPLAGWPVLKIAHIAASVIAVLVLLFVALRLSFLIAPVAAAEDKARLSRAWELSAGNFWRMLMVILAIIVPLLILIAISEYAVLGGELRNLGQAVLRHDRGAILALAIQHGPALVTTAAVAMVMLNALFAGASAAAYRALVPQPRREAEVYVEPGETVSPAAPEPVTEEAHHAEEAPAHVEEPARTEDAAPAEHSEHHANAGAPHDAEAPEPSHEAAAEEPAMELHEPIVQQESNEILTPEVPEDAHAH